MLVLADVLSRPAPEPVAEPAGSNSLTVQQTAAQLGVSTKTVYQLALDGRLRSFRVGRAIRVSTEEIERFQSEGQPPPTVLPLSANNEHGVL